MLVVGLTGGIGSGKSTFAAFLAERGGQVIDADQIARDALRPGEPAWHSVVDQFGDEILAAASMEIDRKRLASIVFSDAAKLAALNAIVHPVLFKEVADRLERLRATDAVVVLDAALIVDTGLGEIVDVLVVVVTGDSAREDRLLRGRSMSLQDVRARMANQLDPAELLARADIVVHNDGSLEDLARRADEVWGELAGRRAR